MVEPTETESKETLDAFAEVLERILQEDAELLRNAPKTTPISRPDEVRAARQPVLAWRDNAVHAVHESTNDPNATARGQCPPY